MSTETFLRLPEEKRNRFLDAAWEEFTRVRYADVSINQIIAKAHIPRGSFYQYFRDKEDLFGYLLGSIRDQVADLFVGLLQEAEGDLFRIHLMVYDRCLVQERSPLLDRWLQMIRLNPGMEIDQMIPYNGEEDFVDFFWKLVDTSQFRQKDRMYVKTVFSLTGLSLASTVLDALRNPEQQDLFRQELEQRLEIIRHGCLMASD